MRPLFSIISPTYNCIEKLKITAQSVFSQNFDDFEYLLVDAASSDGTAEWLSSLKDKRLRFLSEPDEGIYDAMNKGIDLAQGRYLLFLGAGDELIPGALRNVGSHVPANDLTLLYGNADIAGVIYDGMFSKSKLCHKNICHQAVFYGREIFQTAGRFDLKYKFLADYAFNIRCFGHSRIALLYLPVKVAIYEGGGISFTSHDAAFYADKNELLRKHLGLSVYLRYRLERLWAKICRYSRAHAT